MYLLAPYQRNEHSYPPFFMTFFFHPPDLLKKCTKFSDDQQASRFLLFCFFLFRIISEVFAFEVFAFEVFVFQVFTFQVFIFQVFILCKFVRRLVKEQVVRFRKEISAIYPASVGIIFCDREVFVTGCRLINYHLKLRNQTLLFFNLVKNLYHLFLLMVFLIMK